MARRSQFLPWRVAGRRTDRQHDVDAVVRTTGWVFNSETGDRLTMQEFIESGDREAPIYLTAFGLGTDGDERRTLLEIGSGIGRMTCAFTRQFGTVYACDLDAGFLERCREAAVRFGRVDRLRTVPVADGRTLEVPDGVADVVFSYITLQHCDRRDALGLVLESMRVLRPGGTLALNFRQRSGIDVVLLPLGAAMRVLFRIPLLGPWLSGHRSATRLGWQVNRLDPHDVLGPIADGVTAAEIWRHPRKTAPLWGVDVAGLRYLDAINPAHWWLVATKRGDEAGAGGTASG